MNIKQRTVGESFSLKGIEALLKQNLIKGGDLDNAIVIYDRELTQEEYDRIAELTKAPSKDASQLGFIMNKPLISHDEPARHKLLDILGDIALAGRIHPRENNRHMPRTWHQHPLC